MAGIAGLVSAGVGLYGSLTADPTANNVEVPKAWVMPGMNDAARGALGGIQGLPGTEVPGQFTPQISQIAQLLANNPYARMYQQGANTIAPVGQTAAGNSINAGTAYQGAGMSAIPYASMIANTAFDPQSALYAKTQHDLIDQTRAAQSARGVATTPYGAAGESDALRKFDIDWQNAQLGRQIAGGESAGNVLQGGLKTSAGGSALADTGVQNYLTSSALPYSTYNTIGTGQLGAYNAGIGGVSGAQSLALNPVQAYLSYLGVGNQAGAVANNAANVGLGQANLGFNQAQTLGGQFGGSLAGLGRAYNTGFPGASSGWNWLSSFAA